MQQQKLPPGFAGNGGHAYTDSYQVFDDAARSMATALWQDFTPSADKYAAWDGEIAGIPVELEVKRKLYKSLVVKDEPIWSFGRKTKTWLKMQDQGGGLLIGFDGTLRFGVVVSSSDILAHTYSEQSRVSALPANQHSKQVDSVKVPCSLASFFVIPDHIRSSVVDALPAEKLLVADKNGITWRKELSNPYSESLTRSSLSAMNLRIVDYSLLDLTF